VRQEDQGLPVAARPEVASGAWPWPANEPLVAPDPGLPGDLASSWGAQDFGAVDDADATYDADAADDAYADTDAGQVQSAPTPFQPGADLAAYLDAGPEAGPSFAGPRDQAPSGFTRRNRISRGYSIPRLSRTKRPGAVPGAQQPS
jgi:hypothetical protein